MERLFCVCFTRGTAGAAKKRPRVFRETKHEKGYRGAAARKNKILRACPRPHSVRIPSATFVGSKRLSTLGPPAAGRGPQPSCSRFGTVCLADRSVWRSHSGLWLSFRWRRHRMLFFRLQRKDGVNRHLDDVVRAEVPSTSAGVCGDACLRRVGPQSRPWIRASLLRGL